VKLRFFFDWCSGSPFWAGDHRAREKHDVGPIPPEELGLSAELCQQAQELSDWHDESLNWEYPPNPSVWRQEECDRFNQSVQVFFAQAQHELEGQYTLIWQQRILAEDPDLDRYLRDPQGFRR